MNDIRIFENSEETALAAVKTILTLYQETIAVRERFSLVLSGGSTPKRLYQLLAEPEISGQIDWRQVHFFWGDERCVPPAHEQSNYRMVCEALLDHINVPEENINRMCTELTPSKTAAVYEGVLKDYFQDRKPAFDLVLLGMGPDGHTASLFPGTPAVHENKHWTAAQFIDKLKSWRLTLTPVILNQAVNTVFLVNGSEKAQSLMEVIKGGFNPDRLPSQIIRPQDGRLTWFVDKAAAALL